MRMKESLYLPFVLTSVQGARHIEQHPAGLELAPRVVQNSALEILRFLQLLRRQRYTDGRNGTKSN